MNQPYPPWAHIIMLANRQTGKLHVIKHFPFWLTTEFVMIKTAVRIVYTLQKHVTAVVNFQLTRKCPIFYVPCIYRMPGGYRRRLRSLLLWACVQCLTSIVRTHWVPIVCWFRLWSTLEPWLYHPLYYWLPANKACLNCLAVSITGCTFLC